MKYFFSLALFLTVGQLVGQNHLNQGHTVDDPYHFLRTFQGTGVYTVFNRNPLNFGGRPAAGQLYIKLSQQAVDNIYKSNGHSVEWDWREVHKTNKHHFKTFFQSQGQSEVPMVIQISSLFNAYIGATNTIVSVASNLSKSNKVPAETIAELIEEGGRFVLVLTLEQQSGNYYANVFSVYEVEVSGKKRNYVLSKTRYPVMIE